MLICDDEPALRELMRVALVGDYEFAEAESVAEAIEVAERVPAGRRTRRRDDARGLRARRRARIARTRCSRGKCLVVSAFAAETDQEEAREAGRPAFVSKPFDPDELSATVAVAPGRQSLTGGLFPRCLTGGLQRAYARRVEGIRSAPIAMRVLGAIGDPRGARLRSRSRSCCSRCRTCASSTDEQVQANRVTASTLASSAWSTSSRGACAASSSRATSGSARAGTGRGEAPDATTSSRSSSRRSRNRRELAGSTIGRHPTTT